LLLCFFLLLRLLFAFDSVFGEDALVNVSVEKKDDNDGKLAGYIRIRSKTQGIALSLGDRITSVQRGLPENGSNKPQ
jgi:Coatomer beta subunit appendage platform